ncbi:C39 family peptidase [Plantactinospora mayteni]|uniref:C39 family peptidase n=1 Tax=Plantactinospora mayteni TaxID=566021 RepID=UPI001EF5021C|nr:C39 family peptidase [Plantactinospora mayteni]
MALLSAAVVTAASAATAGALLNQPSTPADTGSTTAASLIPPAAAPNPDTDTSASPSSGPQATSEKPQPAEPKAPAEKTLDVSFEYQPNFYYCGPAAVRNALSARGIDVSQDELARGLRTTVNGTDSAEDTTRVLNDVVGSDRYRTSVIPGEDATPAQMDRLQADVVRAISSGYSVVANIVGGETDADGTWHDFPGGHYIALVGYSDDGRMVKVSDSSGMFGPASYWMSTINMANWIGTRGYSA